MTRSQILSLPEGPAKRSLVEQMNRPSGKVNVSRAKRGTGKKSQRKAESLLEARFLRLWTELGGPELQREFPALPSRRYRWDFAHIPSRTLIEINGGNFGGKSGHNTGKGIERDAAKARLATLAGWKCFAFTSREVTAEMIGPVVEITIERL